MMARFPRTRLAVVGAAGAAAFATVAIVAGQSASGWDLSWNAITGGGGKSSGANYFLEGAIIPVDGRSSGGGYVLNGGFYGGGEEVTFDLYLPELARDGAP